MLTLQKGKGLGLSLRGLAFYFLFVSYFHTTQQDQNTISNSL